MDSRSLRKRSASAEMRVWLDALMPRLAKRAWVALEKLNMQVVANTACGVRPVRMMETEQQ